MNSTTDIYAEYAIMKNTNAIMEKRIMELTTNSNTLNLALLLIVSASGGRVEVSNAQTIKVLAELGHTRVDVSAGEKPNGLVYQLMKV